jgi:microcystin-dependent protein
VGIKAGDADFNVLGETGGAKTVTLTDAQLPSHTHLQNAHTHLQNAHTHLQNAHDHTIQGTSEAAGSGVASNKILAGSGMNIYKNATGGLVAMQDDFLLDSIATNQNTTPTNQNTTPTNQNTGGGDEHNNVQPYLVMRYIIKF